MKIRSKKNLFEAAKRSKDHAREIIFEREVLEVNRDICDSPVSLKKHKNGIGYPTESA